MGATTGREFITFEAHPELHLKKNMKRILQLVSLGWLGLTLSARSQDTIPSQSLPGVHVKGNFEYEHYSGEFSRGLSLYYHTSHLKNRRSLHTADVLGQLPGVFIQKSQQGGGSAILRGMEANKVAIVIDGIKLNNLIFRGGHLQALLTTDSWMMERVGVEYSQGATLYGSDAMGGALMLSTLSPKISGEAYSELSFAKRFASANLENSGHVRWNCGGSNWAMVFAATYTNASDLRSGKRINPHLGESFGSRNNYVTTLNNQDYLVINDNSAIQRNSGYKRIHLLNKWTFTTKKKVCHEFNVQYSTSGNIPRYDRLTDLNSSGNLKNAQWYYGPETRSLFSYKRSEQLQNRYYTSRTTTMYTQNWQESRHNRSFGSSKLQHRFENVWVGGFRQDQYRKTANRTIHDGIDVIYNQLKSTAHAENIKTGEVSALDTRYPNGQNKYVTGALFREISQNLNSSVQVSGGVRLGFTNLSSTITDQQFYNLPYSTIKQNNYQYSVHVGISKRTENWGTISYSVNSGYRVPNVDDVAKIFESTGDRLIVPNENIKPESNLTHEINWFIKKSKVEFQANGYFTSLYNLISVMPTTVNGQDSMLYNGAMTKVYSSQNVQSGWITGAMGAMNYFINRNWAFRATGSYTRGRMLMDSEVLPLDHIAPFIGTCDLIYTTEKWSARCYLIHQGKKALQDYSPSGEDNLNYAPVNGMPAWSTWNLSYTWNPTNQMRVSTGIENILDTQYRTFASGINGAGRNFFINFEYNM
jgi:hemoglobin/transferrin/lactoferrin receptor protein